MSRALYLAAFVYLGACLYALAPFRPAAHAAAAPAGTGGSAWFAQVRAMCNPVEVDVGMRNRPPPAGYEGSAYQAACYALAGRIYQAREVIRALPPGERAGAADLFLSIADPVADAGDDRAAGPMMRLVLEFRPDSYIALYHAGMSEYALGDRRSAGLHLRHFLRVYAAEDGWRARAREVLAEMGAGEGS